MQTQQNFWAANIKFLRNRKRLSQDELAADLNISRSKLNAHENGQSVNPTVEDLLNFSAYFKMSVDSLLKLELPRLSELKLRELESGNDIYVTGSKIRVLATTVDAKNRDQIEFVPQKAKAGYLAGYSDPEFISNLPLFHLPHLPKDKKFRMFPTTGDSMYPIPEHAMVIGSFVEDWMNIKEETPCIVVTKEEGIVFKLVTIYIKERRMIGLRSLNSVYEPYEINAGEVVEIWKFVNYISDAFPEPEIPLQEIARVVSEMRYDVKKLLNKK